MKYAFRPRALADLDDASDFYEARRSGLGTEFLIEVGIAIGRILEAPERWPQAQPSVYKYRLDRFPYAVFYRFSDTSRSVDIIAVLDLRRDPNRIEDRLK